jgi:hypothetical protein
MMFEQFEGLRWYTHNASPDSGCLDVESECGSADDVRQMRAHYNHESRFGQSMTEDYSCDAIHVQARIP